jgi:hypothetical protein
MWTSIEAADSRGRASPVASGAVGLAKFSLLNIHSATRKIWRKTLRSSEWYAGEDRNSYIHRAWMRRGVPADFGAQPRRPAPTMPDLSVYKYQDQVSAEDLTAQRRSNPQHYSITGKYDARSPCYSIA